ncbi:MAG: MarR family winged helix-turn-helix transcriptional regulator [Nocardioidaceae bacterium]
MGSTPSGTRSGARSAPVAADAHQLTDVVTRLRRALRASIRTEYSWERLPMAQVEMLQLLDDQTPMRVGDIATRQRLAASTVSGLIGQLMNAGLVERTVDPRDRRAAAVTLTDAGREQLEAWQHAHETRIERALEALPVEDRGRVQAALPALDRLADALDDRGEQPASS